MIAERNFENQRTAKLSAIINVLREQPALRDRDMTELNRMGYLLDRCGMDRGEQWRFVYSLQERCRGHFPPAMFQLFDQFTLDTFAEHLARTSWDEPPESRPANDD